MKHCKNLVRSIKQKNSKFLIKYEVIFRSSIVFVLKQRNQNDNAQIGEGKQGESLERRVSLKLQCGMLRNLFICGKQY